MLTTVSIREAREAPLASARPALGRPPAHKGEKAGLQASARPVLKVLPAAWVAVEPLAPARPTLRRPVDRSSLEFIARLTTEDPHAAVKRVAVVIGQILGLDRVVQFLPLASRPHLGVTVERSVVEIVGKSVTINQEADETDGTNAVAGKKGGPIRAAADGLRSSIGMTGAG